MARDGFPSTVRPFRAVAANADLRRVALAFAGFGVAEYGGWVAVLVFAFERGGAGTAALVGVVQIVPAALVAPVAALLADRHRRDRVLAGAYGLLAVAMGATAAAMAAGLSAGVVYAAATAATVLMTVPRATQAALLPELARAPAEVSAAAVAIGAIENASLFAGPAAAGVLLGLSGPAAVFAGLAALVAGSALLALRLSPQATPRRPAAWEDRPGLARQLVGGFSAALGESGPRVVVGILVAQAAVLGALDVLLVVVAFGLLGMGDGGAGLLGAAFGVGAIVGSVGTAPLVGRRRLAPVLLGGALAWTAALGVTGLAPSQATAPALLAVAGVGRALIAVVGRMILLRRVADAVLARVFGVLEGLGLAGLAVGLLVAPALVAGLGEGGALVACGAVLPVVVAAGWRTLVATDAATILPEAQLRLLRGVPIFAPLPPQTLDLLAGRLVPVDAAAGTTVVRQGDAGDRFYMVADGQVDVTVDGRAVDAHGPGGSSARWRCCATCPGPRP